MSVEETTQQASYTPPPADAWAEEPLEELPPRPRRRLLGKGGSPIFLVLLGVLLAACGFIGGVLVEKGQTSSSTAGAGLASRFAALRGAAGASGTGTSTGGASTSGAGGGFAGRLGGFAGALGSATAGEVAFVSGSTLYVTNAEGTTIKIATSPASSITKTVKAELHAIHPGETVVVRGAKGANGVVSAESISVGSAGAGGGGIASLFGGGGTGAGGRGSSTTGGSSRAGGPELFGE